MAKKPNPQALIPERFRVARPTLIFDRFMNYFITLGGVGIIVAVSLIFVFIAIQIIPLFRGARVSEGPVIPLQDDTYVAMASDEWSEFPFFLTDKGEIQFLDTVDIGGPYHRGWVVKDSPLPEGVELTAFRLNQRSNEVVIGLSDGRFTVKRIDYKASFPDRGGRQVDASINVLPLLSLSEEGWPVRQVAYGDSNTRKLAVGLVEAEGGLELRAVTLAQARTLFGVGETKVDQFYNLTEFLDGEPVDILVTWEADSIILRYADGKVDYLFFDEGTFQRRQTFRPFAAMANPAIASMDFILGDVSVVFTNPDGEIRVWSLYRDPATNNRLYGETKRFPALSQGADFFSMSSRNKAFMVGYGNRASLKFMTTESTRWDNRELPFEISLGIIAPRYNRLLFVDVENNLRMFDLSDPHPAAGFRTYFGRIQYEGQAEATFTWQSTGGRDDFEPKLSMVPLIVGTMKGTVYAMIFAVPIALLAALYTSQFLDPKVKRYVKPTMEIMASLPSVVLGFLAALWLAPIVSNAVPSVVLSLTGFIGGTALFGWGWSNLPNKIRLRVRPGWEYVFLLPAAGLLAYIGWELGPVSERLFFTVTHPDTGLPIPSFRLWYPEFFGLAFEQRNAFVVGFVMGFAVIPIIFTISEDSLSNVPEAFRSGSLALGASRWQTAIRIVLPTASAGIFSALMIGLGRAVGETMIVVMATGNVATTDFNPFTGMRTLSANIAVELPEAPYLGTLYRSLFFGAMLLFLMTFFVNTVAEVLRQKLRERYRAVE